MLNKVSPSPMERKIESTWVFDNSLRIRHQITVEPIDAVMMLLNFKSKLGEILIP